MDESARSQRKGSRTETRFFRLSTLDSGLYLAATRG